MCLLHFAQLGLYIYASTESILKKALQKSGFHKYPFEVLHVEEGTILKIDRYGFLSGSTFEIQESFRFGKWYNWYDELEEEYYTQQEELLLEMCNCYGVTEDDILLLLDYGYSADEIEEITGILNGTTNYMLTKMAEEGADFDEVLKDAQEKGYAEKDPTADIEGHDPCRKIAILTSLVCGRQVDFEDIHCEGITKITADDFKYAKVLNRSIKLLASSRKVGNSYSCMVAPFMLSAEHPLCGVNGVFNGIFVHGNVLGDAMFYGSGAGKLPTASAVVADIVDMTKHKNTNIYIDWSPEKLTLVDYKDSVNSFFVRTSSGKETIENAFGSVEYADAGIAGEIGFTTKDMTEAEFEKAAAQIEVRNRIRLG